MFHELSIRAMVNSVPCYFSSLKFQPNIHVQMINIFNSENKVVINRLNEERNDLNFHDQINIREISRLNQGVTNIKVERNNTKIIVVSKDIIPSQVHELLLNQHKLPENIIPSLKQVQNFVNNFRYTKLKRNSLQEVRNLVQKNLFSDDLEEHDPFFFNFNFFNEEKIIINNGSENKHFHLG
ncbi:unnamed protein product [Brachionus calyciflorus]|uniref:Uncharacterized protein n=1 Tax=Brachionus calyciflorus TaxID=104777 RepID=A0A814DNB3_9BILA|nr:unnamed protein product [Brachionus calyciflorus]